MQWRGQEDVSETAHLSSAVVGERWGCPADREGVSAEVRGGHGGQKNFRENSSDPAGEQDVWWPCSAEP